MINTCPRCGEKVRGIMRLCGDCQRQVDLIKKSEDDGREIQASAWSCP